MILEPKTNEKTTSLSPKSSQSDEGIEKGPQAKLNWVENKGPEPTFHPNPAWVEHKQQKKDQAKRNIQDIWADHTIFVKNSGFRNPQHPSQMYPQFFADEERNLRLAQILCIPIVKLRSLNYHERLQEWAKNVITVFGDTVSERQYRSWPEEETFIYNGPRDRDGNLRKIRARVFFTDLHFLASKMRNGQFFIENLLHTLWSLQDQNERGLDEEEYNKSPLTECYMFSANDCMNEEKLLRRIAIWAKPEDKTINRLSDQFRLYTVSKKERVNIPRHIEVSYAFNRAKFILVPERGIHTQSVSPNTGTAHTKSNTPEATGQTLNEEEEKGEDNTPQTPIVPKESHLKDQSRLTTPNISSPDPANPFQLADLGNSGSKGGANEFEDLFSNNETFRKLFNEKVENSVKEAMREEKLRNSSHGDRLKPGGYSPRDGYNPWGSNKDTVHNRSSSKRDSESEGLMNALCAKDAAVITLENLAPGTINTWGNKAIDFEAKYKPIKWDRMTIPRDVRDLINI